MREIVLDTETTGLDHRNGDRLVEIGCVEILNHIPSGETWHEYFNPERDMPTAAFEVHGLSEEFLSDKPLFEALADDFLKFIGDATLVIHNASFDIGFLNAELGRIDKPLLLMDRVVDTLAIARRKHPGSPANLDALCRRYDIDLSARTKHGALLDSEILAQVYAELTGGRQADLGLENRMTRSSSRARGQQKASVRPEPLAPLITDDELVAHREFIKSLGDEAIWNKYDQG